MANSKYEYTRLFERPDPLLPNTWIVVRIDGRTFHRFTKLHGFAKPNDTRALELMNTAAAAVMRSLPDIVVAYGQSDEYSFVFHPSTALFERRESKLVSTVVSLFTAHYVHHWPEKFPESPLTATLPTFDGRAVLYPSLKELRDYLSWRQVDCHINNLYNTTFWALVDRGGLSANDAKERLDGSVAADKNEILFSQFGINYNNEPEMFKKGSVLFRDVDVESGEYEKEVGGHAQEHSQLPDVAKDSKRQQEREKRRKLKSRIAVEHRDIIKDEFWKIRPWILEGKPPPIISAATATKSIDTNATARMDVEGTK